jgi:hypothetical protein
LYLGGALNVNFCARDVLLLARTVFLPPTAVWLFGHSGAVFSSIRAFDLDLDVVWHANTSGPAV